MGIILFVEDNYFHGLIHSQEESSIKENNDRQFFFHLFRIIDLLCFGMEIRVPYDETASNKICIIILGNSIVMCKTFLY